MEFTQKKQIASGKDRDQLKDLNVQYTDCLAKDFLPDFLAGKQVNVNDYCTIIRQNMMELDRKVYPNDHFHTQ